MIPTVAPDRPRPVLAPARGTQPLAGPALIAIGVIHFAGTPIFHGPALAAIFGDGIVNAIESGSTLLDARISAFWYVAAGWGVLLFGQLTWWVERRVGVLPGALGWLLIAFAVVNMLLVPVSGFWLFLFPAGVVLRRSNNTQGAHDHAVGTASVGPSEWARPRTNS